MSSSALPTVALAGSTGYLGSQVLKVLTSSTFRSSFNEVIVLQRRKSSSTPKSQPQQSEPSNPSTPDTDSTSQAYTIRYYDPSNLPASLQNIDILINTIGPTGHAFKDTLLLAIPSTAIKLYIPSEFGVDHTIHDFPHEEWNHKKAHYDLARSVLQPDRTKVCRIFIGLFIEASIGPWFAFDTKNAVYEAVGSADVPVSFTSLEDTGRVIASVARMPLDQVPAQIHVASDTLTIRELARVMEEAGSTLIQIKEVDLQSYKDAVLEEGTADPSKYLRFLMGEGGINHTAQGIGNDNELVNPSRKVWEWKSMKKYAEETKGRPWADYEWNPESVK